MGQPGGLCVARHGQHRGLVGTATAARGLTSQRPGSKPRLAPGLPRPRSPPHTHTHTRPAGPGRESAVTSGPECTSEPVYPNSPPRGSRDHAAMATPPSTGAGLGPHPRGARPPPGPFCGPGLSPAPGTRYSGEGAASLGHQRQADQTRPKLSPCPSPDQLRPQWLAPACGHRKPVLPSNRISAHTSPP